MLAREFARADAAGPLTREEVAPCCLSCTTHMLHVLGRLLAQMVAAACCLRVYRMARVEAANPCDTCSIVAAVVRNILLCIAGHRGRSAYAPPACGT